MIRKINGPTTKPIAVPTTMHARAIAMALADAPMAIPTTNHQTAKSTPTISAARMEMLNRSFSTLL
jgi:hypothetical protein